MTRLLSLFACVLLVGCTSFSTHRDGDLHTLKHIYVEHLLTDNHRIDEHIVAELKTLGYDASCGPITMMPGGVDAIVTYRERSQWDFKSYLIELNVDVKANFTNKLLATGRYYQPSVYTHSPEEVVHKVIGTLFKRP